jgi:hypothetical protein
MKGKDAMSRAEQLRNMTPQLIADVTLYRTAEGGRRSPAMPGRQAGSIPIGAATPCFDARGLQSPWSIFNAVSR